MLHEKAHDKPRPERWKHVPCFRHLICFSIFQRKVTITLVSLFCSSKLSAFAQCLNSSSYPYVCDVWTLIWTHVCLGFGLPCLHNSWFSFVFFAFTPFVKCHVLMYCLLCVVDGKYVWRYEWWYNSPCSCSISRLMLLVLFLPLSVCSSMFSWPSWRVGGPPSPAQIWPAKRLECYWTLRYALLKTVDM